MSSDDYIFFVKVGIYSSHSSTLRATDSDTSISSLKSPFVWLRDLELQSKQTKLELKFYAIIKIFLNLY